jgi:hypothetical protein
MPLAPGRFSTMKLRPRRSARPFAVARARRSDDPPAAYGMMMVTGLAG